MQFPMPKIQKPISTWRESNSARASVALFVLVIIWLFVPQYQPHTLKYINHTLNPLPVLKSPFEKTVAVIRFNHAFRERLPLVEKYEPFFHTVHYSMPGMIEGMPAGWQNVSHDNAVDDYTIYREVAVAMQLILDAPDGSGESEIQSLLFFHFDAWVDPMDFAGDDFNKIWLPYSPDSVSTSGNIFRCMNSKTEYPPWVFFEPPYNNDFHAKRAIEAIQHFNYPYKSGEFCQAWSDFYLIPRRFWPDFIFLSGFFNDFGVFQEVAIPTVMHIIDESRRLSGAQSVMRQLGDCWGGCCTMNPTIKDVLTHRCGHKFNYPDATGHQVAMAQYNKIDKYANMLGKPCNRTDWEYWQGKGLPAGEENLGSDPEFVISFFRNHKQMHGADEETKEVKEALGRAARHEQNVVNAMKGYS